MLPGLIHRFNSVRRPVVFTNRLRGLRPWPYELDHLRGDPEELLERAEVRILFTAKQSTMPEVPGAPAESRNRPRL